MEPWMVSVIIPTVAIVGGFTYVIIMSTQKARLRELEIRERIAMIEKGLVPPPEVDPRGFDKAMARYDRVQWSTTAARHRRAGIVLLGIGLGLFFMIGLAGDELQVGLGVGGFIATLGVAFLVNSLFELRNQPPANGAPGALPGPPSSAH